MRKSKYTPMKVVAPIIGPRKDSKRYGSEEIKQVWLEEYRNLYTGSNEVVTAAFLQRLGKELLDYVRKDEDANRIGYFFQDKNIPPLTARKWAAKYPEFGEVYEAAKNVVGYRRERGGMKEGWNSSIVLRSLPLLDEEYKEIMEWEWSAKAKANENALGSIKIELSDLSRKDHDGKPNV